MTVTLTDRIERKTKTPYDKVISIFNSGITKKFHFFPTQIMYGYIKDGKIKTVINPPSGISDPFKTRVKGVIKIENGETIIKLKLSPSWVVIGFTLIMCSPFIFSLFSFEYFEILKTLKLIGMLLVFAIIPLGLGKIKLNWDKRRLEKWLNEKIKNSA